MKTAGQLATAAVAVTAAQFARCGWNVFLPPGDDEAEYDLAVSDSTVTLKVSVVGSRSGDWSVMRGLTKGRPYHEAVDVWVSEQDVKAVVCLVQFANVALHELPRMYLATPCEIATRLRAARAGAGDSVLYEQAVRSVESTALSLVGWVPPSWRFTGERLEEVAQAVLLVAERH